MKIKIGILIICLFVTGCAKEWVTADGCPKPVSRYCASTSYYHLRGPAKDCYPNQKYLYVVNFFPCKPCDNYHECIDHVDKCSCEDVIDIRCRN